MTAEAAGAASTKAQALSIELGGAPRTATYQPCACGHSQAGRAEGSGAMILGHRLEPSVAVEIVGGEEIVGPALAQRIDGVWAQERAKAGPALFDGPVLSLVEHSPSRLLARRLRYRHLVAGRKEPEIARALELRSIGVTGVLTCADGLVLGQRGGKVSFDAGLWEPAPAGGLDRPDWREVLADELGEELGLPVDNVRSWTPVALVEDSSTGVVDLVCRIATDLGSVDIERAYARSGSPEYGRIAVVPPEELTAFLALHRHELLEALPRMLEEAGILPG